MSRGIDNRAEQVTAGASGAVESSRGALLISLVDRARHDRRFGSALRDNPVATVGQLGIILRDSEWAGLRELLAR
jgi:hypothetical protein